MLFAVQEEPKPSATLRQHSPKNRNDDKTSVVILLLTIYFRKKKEQNFMVLINPSEIEATRKPRPLSPKNFACR
jgi:hypothetical protein